ncbi:MAG: thioredoxin-dependent thiol peroxidase [Flavobacteriales bacterium]
MKKAEEGKAAPKFVGKDQNGKDVSLESYKGKKLIVYFYPQDNTPTCTVESCNLRDNYKELKKKGFEVIGISADSMKKHQNFIRKFDLPFDLIADTELEIIKSFGVWGEKTTFGKTYDGIHRTTFIIDEDGRVIKRIDDVKSKEHAQQILDELNMN